jgi:DNA-directed RNA polymerase specialized sigma24 family protein
MTTSTPSTETSFETLYATYRPRVEGYIATRLPHRDSQLAEDLASEVFLSLWRSYTTAGRPIVGNPFGLLVTIAARRVADHYRLARSTREAPVDTGHWSFANSNLTPAASGAYEPIRSGFRTAIVQGGGTR